MFFRCGNTAFTMNGVFNLPQSFTTVGWGFAEDMFAYDFGTAFNMNAVFNLPPGIIVVDDNFAKLMFVGCWGPAFNMNAVFNLPQGITAAGRQFAVATFDDCHGAAFTMNQVFNFPQGIISVEREFASYMFASCSGPAFAVNDVFKFPVLSAEDMAKPEVFIRTLNLYGTMGNGYPQARTPASIINGNPDPPTPRETFGYDQSVWGGAAYTSLNANWRM
jgi:hypothetical protein